MKTRISREEAEEEEGKEKRREREKRLTRSRSHELRNGLFLPSLSFLKAPLNDFVCTHNNNNNNKPNYIFVTEVWRKFCFIFYLVIRTLFDCLQLNSLHKLALFRTVCFIEICVWDIAKDMVDEKHFAFFKNVKYFFLSFTSFHI